MFAQRPCGGGEKRADRCQRGGWFIHLGPLCDVPCWMLVCKHTSGLEACALEGQLTQGPQASWVWVQLALVATSCSFIL